MIVITIYHRDWLLYDNFYSENMTLPEGIIINCKYINANVHTKKTRPQSSYENII